MINFEKMITIERGVAVMKTNVFRSIASITLTVSYCSLATFILPAPSIVPELDCVTGISVRAYFVRSGSSGAEELIISLENEGSDTYIFQDDFISSSLAVSLTLKNGIEYNLASSREGSFKYKTLIPGERHQRIIPLDADELTQLHIKKWQDVEKVKPYWDPPEAYCVSKDAVKAAMNEKMDLLVYADSKGGLNLMAQKIEVKLRQPEQRQTELPTISNSLSSLHPSTPLPEPKPPSSSGTASNSSTPWSIIVVLIVAACGLLWLLLKRRS